MKETLKGLSKKTFLTETLSRLKVVPNPQLLKKEKKDIKTVNTYKTTAKYYLIELYLRD